MRKIVTIIVSILILMPCTAYSQSNADYLILSDIGDYKKITKGGLSGNILSGAGHFGLDHKDKSYGISYVNDTTKMWIDVQVTQHAGADSDKWLLHEVERGFRKSKELGATYVSPNPLRQVDSNKIWYTWGYYRWISNYVVVSIEFTDLTGTKPEPIEVVQAYLQKFSSTIPTISIDNAHNEQWLKDEMDRRLWLCDKWDAQFQLGKVQQNELIRELVDQMNVFLDYREKYYGIKAYDEKVALLNYKSQSDLTSIKNKLTEYKNWWSTNKGNPINL
jgi:hypothetical protein